MDDMEVGVIDAATGEQIMQWLLANQNDLFESKQCNLSYSALCHCFSLDLLRNAFGGAFDWIGGH